MDTDRWHRVTVTDTDGRRGVCSVCGPVALKRRDRRGTTEWICLRKHASYWVPKHRRTLGDVCERCGFEPTHPAQLDIHHIDHNHGNNEPDNLRTLCANCHRLEHVHIEVAV